jgi:hypothetical protein
MQFWQTILSLIVGGIIAIGGGFAERIYERRKERESLRAALRAEIQAILAIVERRNYIAGLSNFIEEIKRGSTSLFEIRIKRDYDMVFRSSCGKLGLLPSETVAKTVRFYYLISSIIEDLILLQDASGSVDLRTRYRLDTQRGNLAFHEEMWKLSVDAVALGDDLIRNTKSGLAKIDAGVDPISDE